MKDNGLTKQGVAIGNGPKKAIKACSCCHGSCCHASCSFVVELKDTTGGTALCWLSACCREPGSQHLHHDSKIGHSKSADTDCHNANGLGAALEKRLPL